MLSSYFLVVVALNEIAVDASECQHPASKPAWGAHKTFPKRYSAQGITNNYPRPADARPVSPSGFSSAVDVASPALAGRPGRQGDRLKAHVCSWAHFGSAVVPDLLKLTLFGALAPQIGLSSVRPYRWARSAKSISLPSAAGYGKRVACFGTVPDTSGFVF